MLLTRPKLNKYLVETKDPNWSRTVLAEKKIDQDPGQDQSS